MVKNKVSIQNLNGSMNISASPLPMRPPVNATALPSTSTSAAETTNILPPILSESIPPTQADRLTTLTAKLQRLAAYEPSAGHVLHVPASWIPELREEVNGLEGELCQTLEGEQLVESFWSRFPADGKTSASESDLPKSPESVQPLSELTPSTATSVERAEQVNKEHDMLGKPDKDIDMDNTLKATMETLGPQSKQYREVSDKYKPISLSSTASDTAGTSSSSYLPGQSDQHRDFPPLFSTAQGAPLPSYHGTTASGWTSYHDSVKPARVPVSMTTLRIRKMREELQVYLSMPLPTRQQYEMLRIESLATKLEKEIVEQLDILGVRKPPGLATYSDNEKDELRNEYQGTLGFLAVVKRRREELERLWSRAQADSFREVAESKATSSASEEQLFDQEEHQSIRRRKLEDAVAMDSTRKNPFTGARRFPEIRKAALHAGSTYPADQIHDIWQERRPCINQEGSANTNHPSFLRGQDNAPYQIPQYQTSPVTYHSYGELSGGFGYPRQYPRPSDLPTTHLPRIPGPSTEVESLYSGSSKDFSEQSKEFTERRKDILERSKEFLENSNVPTLGHGRSPLPYPPYLGVRYLSASELPPFGVADPSLPISHRPSPSNMGPLPVTYPAKDCVYDSATGKWGYKERQTIDKIAGPPGKSLFENFNETIQEQPKKSLITKGLAREENALKAPEAYTKPFCDFITENPTVFHAVDHFAKKLEKAGFKKLSERHTWNEELTAGGKYYVTRNASSLIAFTIGGGYKSGNGVAMIAGHIDALTARLKPVSAKKTSAGYVQLGVAPYAGALNTTWWDRDLGIAGKVLVKDPKTGKITSRLVKLGWPIARIPTLAPHFGVGMLGTNNAETQAVPIIGLDNSDIGALDEEFKNFTLGGGAGSFAATQPPKLVRAIAGELSIQDYTTIVNWELELFDIQPAQTGGLDKEFIFAGRIDDKICSWAALEGLLASASAPTSSEDGIVKLVGLFDDEEIGSLLRQGARGNLLPSVIERISETFSTNGASANVLSQTYANSFLISADVTHAVHPNFLGSYLENHAPRLNVGLVITGDSNGHMTTDSVSSALLTRVAEKSGNRLQLFQIRNDSRSGGTIGPSLSSAMGVRALDAGIPQLSMHSIRATTGSLDPGLGVKIFKAFLDHFEEVDKEFE